MKFKRLGGWLSILAILFVPLMPIIPQAIEKDQSNNYQVICSFNGLKLIETDVEKLSNNEAKTNVNHCSYCSFLIDDEVLLSNANKSSNSLIFFSSNLTTTFLISTKQNILGNNHSQAPPSI